MALELKAPQNFRVSGRDKSAVLSWDAVGGAAGYRMFFYDGNEPEKVMKARYAQGCSRTILGFTNGREYFAEVCAYVNRDGSEVLGERSKRVRFVPISLKLIAQKVVCLDLGETAQLFWEEANRVPQAHFVSDSPEIVSVDALGQVTGLSAGTANITITSENRQTFTTRVEVARSLSTRRSSAVMMFTGDIMCAVKQQRLGEGHQHDYHDTFRRVRSMLSGADLAVGVLETTSIDRAPFEFEQLRLHTGAPNCNSPSTFISAVAEAGFGALVTANNHNSDCGAEGLKAAADEIRRCGMQNIGSLGCNPVMISVRGIKVAFIAVTMITNNTGWDLSKSGFVNPNAAYSREYFTELVNAARGMGAEYIAAYQHWGVMNSARVRRSQVEEAQFMADAGADLIIGSHPHLVQRFSYIASADGRRVPCAFSLGNFLTTMNEMQGNRDSAVLRVELTRTESGISTRCSYIPCLTEDREWGAEIVPVYPPHSAESAASLRRTREAIGKRINCFAYRPKIFLSGSVLLGRIFSQGNGFRLDKTGMRLSQLSLGCAKAAPAEAVPENAEPRLRLDMCKDIAGAVKDSAPDYCAVDFYAAAALACWKLGGEVGENPCFFSNYRGFRGAEWFKSERDSFTKINPPFGENIWKPLVKRYAEKLLSAVPGGRIILFRHQLNSKGAKGSELRNVPVKSNVNRFMRAMEDYFISIVHPMTVDLAGGYLMADSDGEDYEPDYYLDCYKAADKLTSCSGRTSVYIPDEEIWFGRVMKYYDSMTARAYQSWLLDMDCAADQLIAYTSVDFISRNCFRLMKLKRAGNTELMSVREFFADDPGAGELISAAEIINALLNGHLDRSYEFFEPAFRGKYNILRKMVKLLSAEIGASVKEDSAELAFLLRGKQQMKRYVAALNRMTLDIWGSCVSRESANRSKDAYIGTYIFKQAPILAFENPVDLKLPEGAEAFCGNKWRRRTMQDSFLRSGDADIKGSESQWILLDMYDLICRMADYKGSLFEIDDFICRTDFYKSIQKDCRECFLFEKRDMKYCFEMITRFAKMILEKYGEHIILIKTEPKDRCITLDNRLEQLDDDGMYEIKKKFISLCEERFASVTGCYVIDISKHFYASDSFPLGGAHIVHYEDEFYRQTGEYITEILSGSSRHVFSTVDDNYLLLRNLRLKR